MKWLTLLFLFLFIHMICTGQVDLSGSVESIKSENLMLTVSELCRPEYDGRLSGTEGYNEAAAFMAEEFRKCGLVPLAGESYYQNLTVETNEISSCKVSLSNGIEKELTAGTDFVCRGFSGAANIKSEIVFCGYGISRPDLNFDEYIDTDVNGKIVLVFKQNPNWKIDNESWGEYLTRHKAKMAADRGAKGIIFVSVPDSWGPKPIGSVMGGKVEHDPDFPQIHITQELANEILKSAGYDLTQIVGKIEKERKPISLKSTVLAEISIEARYNPAAKTMNILGYIEGSDLKEECIVVGAHLDHVGRQSAELYFPGANDNASGSAAVLEIAKAFKENGIVPKRSILFALFTSEEHGLDGATFCAQNLPVDSVVVMLNFDCIAHGDSIKVGGGESFPDLWQIVALLDKDHTNLMTKDTWRGGGADATPFFEQGIPTLYFVTTNSYTHLHLPSDKPETLNPDLFEKITRLGFLSTLSLANAPN